jgi:hypothetical protein
VIKSRDAARTATIAALQNEADLLLRAAGASDGIKLSAIVDAAAESVQIMTTAVEHAAAFQTKHADLGVLSFGGFSNFPQPSLGAAVGKDPANIFSFRFPSALEMLDSFCARFGSTPACTSDTECKVKALEQLLQSPTLLQGEVDDSSVVSVALANLGDALRAEQRHWARVCLAQAASVCAHSSPHHACSCSRSWQVESLKLFPSKVLLEAGRQELKRGCGKATWLRALLERHTDVETALRREQAHLAHKAGELGMSFLKAKDVLKKAKKELKRANDSLSSLREESDSDDASGTSITELEDVQKAAKQTAREAERQMHAQQILLVNVLDALPELRPLLDSLVPTELLPIYREGRTLRGGYFLRPEKMTMPSRNDLWTAFVEETGRSCDGAATERKVRRCGPIFSCGLMVNLSLRRHPLSLLAGCPQGVPRRRGDAQTMLRGGVAAAALRPQGGRAARRHLPRRDQRLLLSADAVLLARYADGLLRRGEARSTLTYPHAAVHQPGARPPPRTWVRRPHREHLSNSTPFYERGARRALVELYPVRRARGTESLLGVHTL